MPANEIVVPAIVMLTLAAAAASGPGGGLVDLSGTQLHTLLAGVGGWGVLTAVNLMLFSLLHNPCGTTILTIWHETRSVRWTLLATLLPLAIGLAVTTTVAATARFLGS